MNRSALPRFRRMLSVLRHGLGLALTFPLAASADNGSAVPYHAVPGATVTLPPWTPAEGPGTMQWFRNGVALPGQTARRLTLPNVTTADAGTYRFVQSQPGFPDAIADYPLNVGAPPATPADGVVLTSPIQSHGSDGAWRDTTLQTVLADGRLAVTSTWVDRLSAHWWTTLFFYAPDGSLLSSTAAGGYASAPPLAILPSGRVVSYYQTLPEELGPRYVTSLSAAAETADGRLLMTYQSGYNVPRLTRLLANGGVDPTFSSPPVQRSVRQLMVDSAGRILVWGTEDDGESRLLRFTADGTPDATFAPVTATALWPDLGGLDGWPITFTLLVDNSLVAVVRSPTTGDFSWRWHFRRVATDGSLPADGRGSIGESFAWAKRPPKIDGQGRAYLLNKHGVWRYFTNRDDALDPTFYGGVDPVTGAAWDHVFVLPDGRLLATTPVTSGSDSRLRCTTLRTTDVAPVYAPGTELVSDLMRSQLRPGKRVVVTPTVFGAGPFSYQWLALDGTPLPADSTSPTLVFENFSVANLGRYQLRVTGPGGTTVSGVVDLTPTYQPRLLALSGRGVIAEGEETLIAGWNTASPGYTLVRAVGPSLAQYGVTGFAADPSLAVFDLAGSQIAANDDWTPELETSFAVTRRLAAAGWKQGRGGGEIPDRPANPAPRQPGRRARRGAGGNLRREQFALEQRADGALAARLCRT